jgi:hypothetical protein
MDGNSEWVGGRNDMQVLTENGFKDFIGVRKSKVNSIYRIEFTDGTHLDATKEHRIKKSDGEFIFVGDCD